MLLDVVGSVELFEADVTVERFLFLVDVFVSGVEVASVGGVGAVGAPVALAGGVRSAVGG